MFLAYIIVTILTAAMNVASAGTDFVRYEKVLVNMARAGVPESWITMLGALKAPSAFGLLVGIAVPPIGIAAAAGLILFFIGAIVTHRRAHMGSYTLPVVFLALATA